MSSARPRSPGPTTAARSPFSARSADAGKPRDFRVDLAHGAAGADRTPPAEPPSSSAGSCPHRPRLRRRDRPTVRRRARYLSPARRSARAQRAHRGDRPARRAAARRRGHRRPRRDGHPGPHRRSCASSSLVGERLGRAWLAYGVTTVASSRRRRAKPSSVPKRGPAAARRGRGWSISAADAAAERRGARSAPYPGIAHGFAHSLRRQADEIAVPPWDAGALPGAACRATSAHRASSSSFRRASRPTRTASAG